MPFSLAIVVVLGLILALGLTIVAAGPVIPVAPYGASDNGSTITLKKGDIFEISLDENPTTGYGWNVTSTQGLTVLDSKYVKEGSAIGAGGVHVWKLEATSSGTDQFFAVYKRPWEPRSEADRTFRLTISVA